MSKRPTTINTVVVSGVVANWERGATKTGLPIGFGLLFVEDDRDQKEGFDLRSGRFPLFAKGKGMVEAIGQLIDRKVVVQGVLRTHGETRAGETPPMQVEVRCIEEMEVA